jgi:hypothetical protein
MHKYKSVEEYLADLDEDKKMLLLKVRDYILETNPSLEEHIKWNAPSYVLDKVDRFTFNTMNKEGTVKLVFHMGTTRKEDKKGTPILKDASLMEWASDIRGYITFESMEYITTNEEVIKRMVSDWLNLK